MNAKKSKYTAAQRKAYYSGMGYAMCDAGKRIEFKSEANKESFKAGLKKGKEKAAKSSDRKGGKNNG